MPLRTVREQTVLQRHPQESWLRRDRNSQPGADTGRLRDQSLAAFAAGDDAEAKKTVLGLARDIGFDAVDAGPLRNARLLEPFAFFNIQLGYALGMGTQIGFKLLHTR